MSTRLRPSWLVALVATLAGVAVATYLTVEHYDSSVTLACPDNGTINCAKVTTSKWSVIAGVPVAVLGLAFFLGVLVLLVLPARVPALPTVRVAAAAVGVLMVFWLVYVELFEVDAICLWCTAVHVLTVVVFAALLWDWLSPPVRETA